jgi:hypothetical protein
MTSRSDLCRSKAVGCEWAAGLAKAEPVRRLFRRLASQWRDLACEGDLLKAIDRFQWNTEQMTLTNVVQLDERRIAKARLGQPPSELDVWKQIATAAPFTAYLELAVMDWDGPHALAFPCRRILGGWIDAETLRLVDVRPTHWREWQEPA